ncbi:hypothetical protein ACFE04_030570 [Oxalis oulophora]
MDTTGTLLDHPNERQLDPAIRMLNGTCKEYIPVYSNGIWDKQWQDIFHHPLALLQFQLVIIFLITNLLHYFIGRLHLPRMISDILTGIILGPSFMRRIAPKLSDMLFPPMSMKILLNLTRFGYLLFMFMIGVKMDFNLVSKSGKRAWIIASIGVVFPFLFVAIVSVEILSVLNHDDYWSQEWVRLFVGLMMITSFPVVACLLMHLKILNTELGRVALSSALCSDLLSVIVINSSNFQRIMKDSQRAGLVSMILTLILVVAIWTVFRSIMLWIIRQTPEEKHVKSSYLFWIVMTVLVVEIFGDNVGLTFLYGPFLLGLSVPTGPPLASTLVERLDTMITGLFLPLISFYCGYKSDVWKLELPSKPIAFIIVFGMPYKFIASLVTAICCKVPLKDATGVALILSAKGIVELGTLACNVVRQPIDSSEFALTVLMVIIIATVVQFCVRGIYDPTRVYTGYQKRDIQHNVNREGLKILACAYRQDDATAAYKLLECCKSTKENPVYVYALNLEELKGGSAPLLINHQLGQKANSSKTSDFHPVIDVFNFFKIQKSVQVHLYTAISPLLLMDEDICWLAFDQSVSLVILPFHRKWDVNGKLVLESSTIRTLNDNVLKKAPCSVGILIDRRSVRGATSILTPVLVYRVAMLHMGGEDDIETLAYAKQMARCSSVQLTVIRFTALDSGRGTENGWSKMLVDECLRDIKRYMISNPNVSIREETVMDGVDTARIIQSIEMEYDLIMVGRRHKDDSPVILGLSEWCELPELGPIGDILAASDLNTSVSVLCSHRRFESMIRKCNGKICRPPRFVKDESAHNYKQH